MRGCITAILTPFNKRYEVDYERFRSLVEFQIKNNVKGIVVAGTTGEGPTLTIDEWKKLVEIAIDCKAEVIANTGFNSTAKTLEYAQLAYDLGCRSFLMVDPYYNAPSSLEIRKEYYEPVASKYGDCKIIPYVIPGRTGTQLLPVDLAILHSAYPNIEAVKDATGSDQYSRDVRRLCGNSFNILSGDDERTFFMMTDDVIRANGVISVISNIAPGSVQRMVTHLLNNEYGRAKEIYDVLKQLFQLVTVKTEEEIRGYKVSLKFRNPVPVKTLASILGIPAGPCRRPLGRISSSALKNIIDVARSVAQNSPEVFDPVEEFFDINIEQRLNNPSYLEGLAYD
ncbi:MAG: 4-hydroxy-tetrahydrodipicolinate synthase [Conexivisphaerales archaeon]